MVFTDGKMSPLKGIFLKYLGKTTFRFCKQRKIYMVFLETFLRGFCTYLNADNSIIFDQENHDRILKEYYEQKGIEKGKILTEIQLIQRMISKNLPLDTLSQFFEESALNTSQIAEAIQQHPEMDESQIYALLYESLSGEEKDI